MATIENQSRMAAEVLTHFIVARQRRLSRRLAAIRNLSTGSQSPKLDSPG
jgi:hypothetical protein